LHPDSTTAERDLLPYWNDYTGAISSHLWLPTGTASPASAPSSSSKCSSKTVANSWFSTSEISAPQRNSPRIYSPSLLSSLPEPTDSAGTGRKSRRIRIYPDRQQKAKLKLWLDAARFTYNRTIELLTSDGAPKASWLKIKKDILTQLPQWTKPVPYEVKSHAIRDACLAVSAVKKFNKQLKIDRAKGIRLQEDYAHFRSRRDDSQTIFIHSSAISVKGVYHTLLGNLKLREPIPHAHGDAKLTLRHHQYHLSVPFKRMGPHISESNLRSQAPEQVRVVALDPGVRNFITWFSEDGCGELGQEDFGRIQRLCQHQDNLLSRATQAPSRKRRNMRRAAERMTVRIQNLINELHHKTARYLVDNFDVILLPDFKTSGMVTRGQRRIRSKTVRNLLSFAHHRFRNFLRHKASENGRTVLIVNEAYTSKTVSWTGEINHKLGGRRTVTSSDGRRMDRDHNGARGIFLRALGDTPSLRQHVSGCVATNPSVC
jgi:putative transposase